MKIYSEELSYTFRVLQEAQSETNRTSEPVIDFLWYFIPSYLFVLFSIIRYCMVLRIVQNEILKKSTLLVSIQTLCYLMALTYCAQVTFGILSMQMTDTDNKNTYLRLLYIGPIIAWILASHITNTEIGRSVTPRCYNQLLFSTLSLVAAVCKLVFDLKAQVQIQYIIINSLQILLSLLITVCFIKSEKMNSIRRGPNQPLMDDYQLRPLVTDSGIGFRSSQRVALPIMKVTLARTIERRAISPRIVENNFHIKVQINDQTPYGVVRSLSQFVELERDMKMIYTLSRYPVLSTYLPLLEHKFLEKALYQDSTKDTEVIEKLEVFLQEIVDRPEFMQDVVVDFLELPEPCRSYFIQYIDNLESRTSYQQSFHRSNTGISTDNKTYMLDQKALEELDIFKLQLLQFEVNKVNYYRSEIEGEMIYNFEVIKLEKGGIKQSWMIGKSYHDFVLNSRKMEAQLHSGVPDLQRFVPETLEEESDLNPAQLQGILEGLEKYLKALLGVKKLYCVALLEFVGLDPVTWQKGYSCSENDFLIHEDT